MMAEGTTTTLVFHPGDASATSTRRRGRPNAAKKCRGRPSRQRRGDGVAAPKLCKGGVLSCCDFCVKHCECAPEVKAASVAARRAAAMAKRQVAPGQEGYAVTSARATITAVSVVGKNMVLEQPELFEF